MLFCYSGYGKITLIAKGAKSYRHPYHSFSDYFTLIEAELSSGKSMQTLKKAVLVDDYQALKKLSNVRYLKSFINALNYLVTDDLPHERLFKMLLLLLDFKDIEVALLTFYIKLTYALGYQLTFYQNDYWGFNIELGKTITKDENFSSDLNLRATNDLKRLYYLKEEIVISKESMIALKQFIKAYYKYHMDYNIEV